MDDNDRSVPIVTQSVTRTEHQLYEDKQEVSNITIRSSQILKLIPEAKRTSKDSVIFHESTGADQVLCHC